MKKILILTAVSVLFVGCSATNTFTASPSPIIDLSKSSSGTSSSGSSSSASGTLSFPMQSGVAKKYNRENTVSTADIQKLSGGSSASSGTSYDDALKAAKAEQNKAKKMGFEWNTIGKLMKAAKKDHKAGKTDAAIKKLITAKEHAILGQKQAEVAANAGPLF